MADSLASISRHAAVPSHFGIQTRLCTRPWLFSYHDRGELSSTLRPVLASLLKPSEANLALIEALPTLNPGRDIIITLFPFS